MNLNNLSIQEMFTVELQDTLLSSVCNDNQVSLTKHLLHTYIDT